MSREESIAEIKRAEKSLSSAKTLCENKLFEDSISRSYYDVSFTPVEEHVKTRIEQAGCFVERIRDYLKDAGVL